MKHTNEQLNRMAAGVDGWRVECSGCEMCGFEGDESCLSPIPDYCNDRNHAVRVAEAVDHDTLDDVLEELWSKHQPYVHSSVWVATLPAKTLLLAAFVAHGIMPMDEAKKLMEVK